MYAKDVVWLKKISKRFNKEIEARSHLFRAGNHQLGHHAVSYCKGLIQAPTAKRNIERMHEAVPETLYDPLQGFISDSPWNHEPVHQEVMKEADMFFNGHPDTCLLLDETCVEKKGKMSAGVSRQWNGRLGKVDNCQVAVMSSLNCGDEVILVGAELYMPKEWIEDEARCEKAKVPLDRRTFKTKPELALGLIDKVVASGARFNWIGADGFYGKDPSFLRSIDNRGLTFVVDIHSDQRVFLNDFSPSVPIKTHDKGRAPIRLKTEEQSVRVDSLIDSFQDKDWRVVTLRDSKKGKLKAEAIQKRVWLWNGEEEAPRKWTLIVSRNPETKKDLKYSLTNPANQVSLKRLVFMQRQRYWIENSFETAKSDCGLADYQVRSWTGWHHHVALVMLTCLFMQKEKRSAPQSYHLLSGNDIRELLCWYLPNRKNSEEEIFRQLQRRHQQRQKDIDRHYPHETNSPLFNSPK